MNHVGPHVDLSNYNGEMVCLSESPPCHWLSQSESPPCHWLYCQNPLPAIAFHCQNPHPVIGFHCQNPHPAIGFTVRIPTLPLALLSESPPCHWLYCQNPHPVIGFTVRIPPKDLYFYHLYCKNDVRIMSESPVWSDRPPTYV